MGSIWNALVQSYAFLATVPIIPFILVYVIMTIRGNDKKSAIQLSMDVTTAFLFGCVASLLNDRLGTSFGPFFLLLVMLVGGGLIGNAQNRARGKVDPRKLLRAVWRLSFFGLSVLYIILMLLAIVFPIASD
ncbi:DUF3397 domain-containing protein [Cohnella sp. LGH]|uniref:Uncharacterized protein DUF3397 n=1 Tax=Cohnella phaseoli TaxID=456490 RepID=A0A3D9IRR4_9BACL|nr:MULTISPECIES: DUF3397 domain-containing protein [Cohnella]QTH46109.1 DUF3397 domain-containing protein [Cohnella sp. LGH]RED64209.1 uncharacterized protein DUF3397 [Cohnella phaseoli]